MKKLGESLAVAVLFLSAQAYGQQFKTLYSFHAAPDGFLAMGALAVDPTGNVYGVTKEGGAADNGIVYMIAPDGTQTVLHTFHNQDGKHPTGLIRDVAGNLYGTANGGGANGYGNLFKLSAGTWKETVLHDFGLNSDGRNPVGQLIRDAAGNFYGATLWGGHALKGSAYQLAPNGTELIFSFGGNGSGNHPPGFMALSNTALYGTAQAGGCCGVVFRLDITGKETILHKFTGGADGGGIVGYPPGGVTHDKAGNLYGTTPYGGDPVCNCGVVFKIDPAGGFTVLHTFTGGTDGATPYAGLKQDAAGNLYGTTYYGGDLSCYQAYSGLIPGCGVVFKMDTAGNETVLYSFTGGTDGAYPQTPVTVDNLGNIYGTTWLGGDVSCFGWGCGVVFEISGVQR